MMQRQQKVIVVVNKITQKRIEIEIEKETLKQEVFSESIHSSNNDWRKPDIRVLIRETKIA